MVIQIDEHSEDRVFKYLSEGLMLAFPNRLTRGIVLERIVIDNSRSIAYKLFTDSDIERLPSFIPRAEIPTTAQGIEALVSLQVYPFLVHLRAKLEYLVKAKALADNHQLRIVNVHSEEDIRKSAIKEDDIRFMGIGFIGDYGKSNVVSRFLDMIKETPNFLGSEYKNVFESLKAKSGDEPLF